jgi:cell division protein FtsL
MSGLEKVFLVEGIIFMSIMLALIVVLIVKYLKFKSKINRINDNIDKKINSISHFAERAGELAALANSMFFKKAKKSGSKK